MTEFIAAILSPINLVLTVLLAVIIGYWLFVILGVLGMDVLDFDTDPDVDADLEIDPDVAIEPGTSVNTDIDPDIELHSHGHAHSAQGIAGGGMALSVMRFFNVGTVPLTILISVLVLMLWMMSVALHPLIGEWNVAFKLVMLVPTTAVAALVTKIITTPLAIVFTKLQAAEKAETNIRLVGQRCTVVTGQADASFGQAEVQTDGAPIRLSVRTTAPGIVIPKGAEAVLVAHNKPGGFYHIRAFDP
ncbi:MAG: hypothetical protein AAFY88_32305 [Acidobacteriota bacterium]